MSDPTPPPPGNPYGAPPPYAPIDPDKRPGSVTAASIITIVLSALSLALFGILAIVLAAARGDIIDEINRELEGQPGFEDIAADDLANLMVVVFVVLAIWSLVAIVTAVLAMKRHNWARIVTVVSAGVTALFSLLGIMSGISAITLIAAIAVVVLYFTGGASEWYQRRNAQPQLPVGTSQPWG